MSCCYAFTLQMALVFQASVIVVIHLRFLKVAIFKGGDQEASTLHANVTFIISETRQKVTTFQCTILKYSRFG